MKLLITGRSGQLVTSLLERGDGRPGVEIVALGRPELDLEDAARIEAAVAAIGADVVINAAAYTAVDAAEDDPERAFAVNATAAGVLARAARASGARFVQISTDYVFDGSAPGFYDEDAAVDPLGVYGHSKLAGERLAARENPDTVVVRTAWVYSPFGKNFLKTMLALAGQRDELGVVADQFGTPSCALDLADGLFALLAAWRGQESGGLGQTYHLAGGGDASWHDFASHIMAVSAQHAGPAAWVRPIRTEDWPTRAARPRNSRLDSGKFARDFGYRAPHWRESTAAVVARLLGG